MSLTLQYLLIGLLVASSLLYMVRKLAPQVWLRLQTSCATTLSQPTHSSLVRSFGRLLQPKQAEASGCDSGCNTCSGCASDSSALPNEQPLTFHPRHR